MSQKSSVMQLPQFVPKALTSDNFMDAIGDLDHTRAFMTTLRDNLSRWLAQLRAIEQGIVATHGDASEHYSDRGFHQFAALRMGIHSIGSKVAWCDETLAAIDRRLASMHRCEAAEGSESNEREGFSS